MLNITSDIIAYENGELDQDETIAFFQKLLDTGIINHLQGHYGRTAAALIANGDITHHNTPTRLVCRNSQ